MGPIFTIVANMIVFAAVVGFMMGVGGAALTSTIVLLYEWIGWPHPIRGAPEWDMVWPMTKTFAIAGLLFGSLIGFVIGLSIAEEVEEDVAKKMALRKAGRDAERAVAGRLANSPDDALEQMIRKAEAAAGTAGTPDADRTARSVPSGGCR